MIVRVSPLVFCTLSLMAGQETAAPPASAAQVLPVPPAPAPLPAPLPLPPPAQPAPASQPTPAPGPDTAVLKLQLDDLQNRLRQQQEDGIVRLAEFKTTLADLVKKLAALEGLPAQVKASGDEARAAGARSAALDKQHLLLIQARLEGDQAALQAVLAGAVTARKTLQALGPLTGVDLALGRVQETMALPVQPGFTALVATVRDKLAKGPLGNPLRDPAVTSHYFDNPILGSAWLSGAVDYGPGWESDKLRNLDKALGALDMATRMVIEVKTARAQVSGLKAEAALILAEVDEALLLTQGLVDPAASGSAIQEGDALALKVETTFKPLLEAAAKGGLAQPEREALVALIAARHDLQALVLTQRLFLVRMAGVADSLALTFGRCSQEEPCKDLPALAVLVKAVAETQARLKVALATQGPAGKALAKLQAAAYR